MKYLKPAKGTGLKIILRAVIVITLISGTVVSSGSRADSQDDDLLTTEERNWLSEHNGKIRYAQYSKYPPISFMDQDGVCKGVTEDYIRLIEKKLNFRFERVPCDTWTEILEYAKQGKIDVVGTIQDTPERRKYLRFTTPYITTPNSIITKKSTRGSLTADKLAGMKVVIVAGYSSYDWVESNYPDIILEPVKDDRTGLEMVSFGRADAMITDLAVASYYIEELGIANLRVAGSIDYKWNLCFASKKDWIVLHTILQKALNDISSGERETIYNKWIHVNLQPYYKNQTFQIILAVSVLIIVISIFWNGRLRKEIKERKKAEKVVREERDLFQTFINALPDTIFFKDVHHRFIRVNEAKAREQDTTPEQMIGKNDFDYFTKKIAQKAYDDDEYVLKTGKPIISREEKIRHADGSEHWVSVTKLPRRSEDGKIIGTMGIARDITERKQAEKALKESEERLDLALKGTGVGTWDWRIQTDEIIYNERWAEIIGYTLEELSPISTDILKKYTHPDDLKKSNALIKKHFSGETDHYECELRMKHKNGNWIWILDRGKVFEWDEDDKPIRMVGTHLDITAQKKIEEERERVISLLEEKIDKRDLPEGFIPICAGCHKIRDEQGVWHPFVNYLSKHTNLVFSHGMCPDCMKEYYGEDALKKSKADENE